MGVAASAAAESSVWTIALVPRVEDRPTRLAELLDPYRSSEAFVAQYGNLAVSVDPQQDRVLATQIVTWLTKAGVDPAQIMMVGREVQLPAPIPTNGTIAVVQQSAAEALAKLRQCEPADVTLEWQAVPALPEPGSFAKATTTVLSTTPDGEATPLRVEFLDANGGLVATRELRADVEIRMTMLVAAHPIMPGTVVTAKDFSEAKCEQTTVGNDIVRRVGELGESSWQVVQGMEAGQPLSRSWLKLTTGVQKGAIVSIVARDKRFQIRAMGRVKAVMDNGTTVLVENLDSKRELVGRPINENEVEIVF